MNKKDVLERTIKELETENKLIKLRLDNLKNKNKEKCFECVRLKIIYKWTQSIIDSLKIKLIKVL